MAVFSHPLDVSLTVLQIQPGGLRGTTYIHPYELTLLAKSHNLSLEESDTETLRQVVFNYFNEHFRIVGRRGLVAKTDPSFSNSKVYEILADGLYLNYWIPLPREQYPISFQVDLFVEYSNTQTNKVVFFNQEGELYPDSEEVIFTSKRHQWSFDLNRPDFSSEVDDLTDMDGDGLTDRFEVLYGLQISNPDTDADGYSDLIEITYGWDPFDANPSPGQSREVLEEPVFGEASVPREQKQESTVSSPVVSTTSPETDPASHLSVPPRDADYSNLIKQYNVSDKAIPNSRFLQRTMVRMASAATNKLDLGALLSLCFAVFALGFLHASLPGHGNAILASYLTVHNRKFRHALGFIGTFTLTHLMYVSILAVALTAFSASFSSARVTQILKLVGGSGLLVISVYLIFRGVKNIRNPRRQHQHTHQDEQQPKTRGAAVMGFLAGLVPCTYGWALLMMILSLGRFAMIPFVLLPFALGIFTFLVVLAAGIMILRYVVIDLFSRFQKYSYLVSGILLLIFSVVFFTPRMPTI